MMKTAGLVYQSADVEDELPAVAIEDVDLPEGVSDVQRLARDVTLRYAHGVYDLGDDVLRLVRDYHVDSGLNEFLGYIDRLRTYAGVVASATSWLVADLVHVLFEHERERLSAELGGVRVSDDDVLESVLTYLSPIYGLKSVSTAYRYLQVARRFPPDKRLKDKSFVFHFRAYELERAALDHSGRLPGYRDRSLPYDETDEDPVLRAIAESRNRLELSDAIARHVGLEDAYLILTDSGSGRILCTLDVLDELGDRLFAELGRGTHSLSAFVRWLSRLVAASSEEGSQAFTLALGDAVLYGRFESDGKRLRVFIESAVLGGDSHGDS